jgi:hypothetical protein
VDVVGYVRTTYGRRGVAETLADVDRWSAWYQVDGIFFDEVSTTLADVGYYRLLAGHVRRRGSSQARVIFNPGTQTVEEHMPLCDVVLNFEGSWAAYRRSFADNPSWVQAYSASRFWHVIYDCPSASAMRRALALARARNASWVFVTSGSGANPYACLPVGRYWLDELRQLGHPDAE